MPLLYFVFGLALLVLLYLKAIRPQQQILRAQQQVVASLAVGDRVISSAGIFGLITALTDDVATLEVAPGVNIQVARAAIARRVELDPGDRLNSQLLDLTAPEAPVPGVRTPPDGPAADGTVDDDHPALRED